MAAIPLTLLLIVTTSTLVCAFLRLLRSEGTKIQPGSGMRQGSLLC